MPTPTTAEGMHRAVEAGVETIEHGDEGTDAAFKELAAKGIAYCPTLAASEAVAEYRGWTRGSAARAAGARAEESQLRRRAGGRCHHHER